MKYLKATDFNAEKILSAIEEDWDRVGELDTVEGRFIHSME